ncbi:bZIP transcription factor [Phlyctema vagabunda]|uniref:BZIP transcription factor n=1 Tax=Phlyctema vagabunda TaxID=108571 RepID=A0ABR4PIT9_9HELO
MSVIANVNKEDLFQNIIDPSYLSIDFGAGPAINYNDAFTAPHPNATSGDINPFLWTSAFGNMAPMTLTPNTIMGQTGLTPNLHMSRTGLTPIAGNILFDDAFQVLDTQSDLRTQIPMTDSSFPPMMDQPGAGTDLSEGALSPRTQVQESLPVATTDDTRKQTRSRKHDHASPAACDRPPVKKRRNRKKKQPPTEDEARFKRERFLERNRIAASKCRTKKKQSTSQLEAKLREFQAERKRMEYDIHLVMSELDLYREELQKHARCGNQAIEIWLNARADAVADKLSSVYSERKLSSYSPSSSSNIVSRQDTHTSSGTRTSSQSTAQPSELYQNHGSAASFQSSYSSPSFDYADGIGRQSSVVSTISAQMEQQSIPQDSGISDMGSPYQVLDKSTSLNSSDFVLDERKQAPALPRGNRVA